MTDYFVDPQNGASGNSGTSRSNAKASLKDFDSSSGITLSAGDVINIMDTAEDALSDVVTFDHESGASGNPIVIQSDLTNNSRGIIDGSGLTTGQTPIILDSCEYFEFRNLEMKDAPRSSVLVRGNSDQDATNVDFVECYFHDFGRSTTSANAAVFLFRNVFSCTFERCEAYNGHSSVSDGFRVGGDASLGYGQYGYGLGDYGGGVFSGDARFTDCEASYVPKVGFNLAQSDNSNGSELVRCISHHNGRNQSTWDSGDTSGNTGVWGDGQGYRLGGIQGGNSLLYRCIGYQNSGRALDGTGARSGVGFDDRGPKDANEYINCATWNNYTKGFVGAYGSESGVEESLFVNCSSFGEPSQITGVHASVTCTWTEGYSLTSSDWASFDPSSADFLRVASASTLVDDGTIAQGLTVNVGDYSGYTLDLSSRGVTETYSGVAPDVGARDFQGTITQATESFLSAISFSPKTVNTTDTPDPNPIDAGSITGFSFSSFGAEETVVLNQNPIDPGAITPTTFKPLKTGYTVVTGGGGTTTTLEDFEDYASVTDLRNEYEGNSSGVDLETTTVYEGTQAMSSNSASSVAVWSGTDYGEGAYGYDGYGGGDGYSDTGQIYEMRLNQPTGAQSHMLLMVDPDLSNGVSDLYAYKITVDFGFSDEFKIARVDNGVDTTLNTESISESGLTDVWLKVEASISSTGVIEATLYDDGGTEVSSISAVDTTYQNGNWGFAFDSDNVKVDLFNETPDTTETIASEGGNLEEFSFSGIQSAETTSTTDAGVITSFSFDPLTGIEPPVVDSGSIEVFTFSPIQTSETVGPELDEGSITGFRFRPKQSPGTATAADSGSFTSLSFSPLTADEDRGFIDDASITAFTFSPITLAEVGDTTVDTSLTAVSFAPLTASVVKGTVDPAGPIEISLTPISPAETALVEEGRTEEFTFTPLTASATGIDTDVERTIRLNARWFIKRTLQGEIQE